MENVLVKQSNDMYLWSWSANYLKNANTNEIISLLISRMDYF